MGKLNQANFLQLNKWVKQLQLLRDTCVFWQMLLAYSFSFFDMNKPNYYRFLISKGELEYKY